jgi:ribosomal protein S18 acetylase RimI-like enzyme
MTGPHATEARRLDLADPGTLRRLRNLQRASYAVEAELIGFDGIPALHESLEDLRDCGESFLGLDDETGLAGAVSWVRLQDGTLDICRLMVHPRAHRRGIATALLDALDRAEPAWRAVVSTGTANHPALGLYQQRGFTPAGTRLIAPGTSLTLLERRSTPPGGSAHLEALTGAAAQRALPVSRNITRTASGPPGPDSAALAQAIQMQRGRPAAGTDMPDQHRSPPQQRARSGPAAGT